MIKIFSIVFLSLYFVSSAFAQGRFYYEGDGCLYMINNKTKKKFKGCYRNPDGTYNSKAIIELNNFFQIPKEHGEDYSLRTLAFIDYLQDKYVPNKKTSLKVTSAYRSPAYNEKLRKKGALAGQTSYHIMGMAADLIFPGTSAEKIWEETRKLNYGGVGYYRNKALHIDSGKPRSWTPENAIDKEGKPPLNENIYASVDQDIYLPGETLRLFFSGISNFPFGVKKKMEIRDASGKTVFTFSPEFANKSKNECVVVDDPTVSRHVLWEIPKEFKHSNEKLRIHMTFCDPTYAKMPKEADSREFEVHLPAVSVAESALTSCINWH